MTEQFNLQYAQLNHTGASPYFTIAMHGNVISLKYNFQFLVGEIQPLK
jgi:hypothetical protein